MGKRLPEVEDYISKAKPFAQPILLELREAFHRASPEVEEAIKWSRPFFLYRGIILGNVSAFKEHCSLGLWGAEMADTLRADGVDSSEGMGSFGRITSAEDLPPKKKLDAYLRKAVELIESGTRTKSFERVAKVRAKDVEIPPVLAAALGKNKAAAEKFEAMSPSCRREYANWIAEAKQEATRERRLAQAMEQIAEGKSHNWKYETKR